MQAEAYILMAQVENEHWWWRGRRAVLRSVLGRYAPESGAGRTVLEVGCGSGGNLPMLSLYGTLCAVELDDGARTQAVQRGLARVEKGWLPDGLPFDGERFDLIAALDVLEHIDDDRGSLRALRERLSPNGLLLLTVPAYMWLWSSQDEFSHHRRRYTRSQCVSLVRDSGLEVLYSSYFNTLLFPLAVARIALSNLFGGSGDAAVKKPPGLLNCALKGIFASEGAVLPRLSFPYGLSIVVCARAK